MSTTPICPCDAANPNPITNLPGLSQISFRAGDFNSFRRALLTPLLGQPGQPPLEVSLTDWQSGVGADPSVVDLAVMMVEWWAYLSDILTFYNERIANEDYLRTAMLPETPGQLVRLLGYRPRPAIGATGNLAALVSPSVLPGQTVTLPTGLQFQSKPGPGGAPQTFELFQPTAIGRPDQVPATTPPNLISASNSLLLKGTVTSISNGDLLLLGTRDNTSNATPYLITISASPSVQTVPGGVKQTVISFTSDSAIPAMTAENARLMKPNQTAALWTVNGSAVSTDGKTVEMAGVVRQIRPGDWVVFSAPSIPDTEIVKVTSVKDVFGDASSATGAGPASIPSTDTTPILVLHSELTLAKALDGNMTAAANAPAISVLCNWVEVGTLLDQPPSPWDGEANNHLDATEPAQFPAGSPAGILLADANGVGQAGTGTTATDGSLSVSWPPTMNLPLSPEMQPQITVYYNLLPVTCGKTIAKEVLGSGDATVAGQSFKLAKSPVTYLTTNSNAAGYASTVTITVNGLPWTEVPNFYGQPADAQVFVTREDSSQNTWVDFGDGVNGARLLTGTNNVVATYRIGGGASSPPAGKLTVIAQSYPGLQSVANPVAVAGGSDPDPASLLKQYAPRSVLTFGRAVSVFDYQALAAQYPGVTMASASWSWDDTNSRGTVTVYVAGEENIAASVQTALAADGDPNRPVVVLPATPIDISLTMAFVVPNGADTGQVTTALQTALCDPVAGLFSPANLGIGQGVFDSQIEAVCLTISGVQAIVSSQFTIGGVTDAGPLHSPGEGNYYSLDPSQFFPSFGGSQ